MTAQLDLFSGLTDDQTGDVVRTPADPHRIWLGGKMAGEPGHRQYRHWAECAPEHGCGFQSEEVERENDAVEAGLDHAWPGWRNLPVVTERPNSFDDGPLQAWLAKVTAVYPPGWVAAGGPVRTTRPPGATRHHRDDSLGYWDVFAAVRQR